MRPPGHRSSANASVSDDEPVTHIDEREGERVAPRRRAARGGALPPQSSSQTPPGQAGRGRRVGVAGVVLLVLVDLVRQAGLTSLSFLILLLLAACGLAATVNWAWNRWPARGALWGRALSLVLIACMGSVLSLDILNRSEHFYASFSDLAGGSVPAGSAPSTLATASRSSLTVLTPHWQRTGARQARAGRGTLIRVDIRGAASGLDRPALIDLPPEFFLAPTVRLPAIEMLHGWPGAPINIVDKLGAVSYLDQERLAYRMPPVIAVVPTVSTGGSTECVDAVHGQLDGTYLADDVPQAVTGAFRVLGGASWATLGYSTGGFCAANLALRHADRYAAGASLSGYFTAAQDPGTARLYRHNTTALHHNSPTWLLAHVHLTGPPLFAMASGGDLYAVHQQRALLRAAHAGNPGFPLTGTLLPSGGHNYGTWRHALPAALDWLGAYLPRPSAPLLELPLAPGGGVALPAATHVTHSTHRTRRNAVRPPPSPPRTPDVTPSPAVSHYPSR